MARRFLILFLFAGLGLLQAVGLTKAEAAHEDDNFVWKVVNFAIFAGGIGYAVVKYGPAFFNARSADIQKAIQDATGLKMNADLRYSEIDRKMANLSGEVGRLRAESQVEMDREHARVVAQTQEEIAYIQRNNAAEIEALRGEATEKLRVLTTQDALARAEDRLRARFAGSDQNDLFADFVQLIERGKN